MTADIIPVVVSISKNSSSPILKSTLIITGSKFSNINKTKVYLTAGAGYIKYELTIVSMNSTSIECILGGGKTGSYNVTVFDVDTGRS